MAFVSLGRRLMFPKANSVSFLASAQIAKITIHWQSL